MSKSLIALAVIAAGALAADSPEISSGAKFEAPDDVADGLIDAGKAKLADAAAPAQGKAAKRTKVRLTVDSALGNCNDVVEVDAGDVKTLEKDGLADGGKEAVAYAMTLEQNKPKP